jgi:hypothetical protein
MKYGSIFMFANFEYQGEFEPNYKKPFKFGV